jgi:hypothetical protein
MIDLNSLSQIPTLTLALFAIAQLATLGTALLNFIISRQNSRKIDQTQATASVIQKSVNGHLDKLYSDLKTAKGENPGDKVMKDESAQ